MLRWGGAASLLRGGESGSAPAPPQLVFADVLSMLLSLLLAGARRVSAQSTCNTVSVSHEIYTPNGYPAQLTAQSMRTIPKETQQAKDRGVPFEPPSSIDETYLQWEFHETRDFIDKALDADPRLQPDDIEVTTDHMNFCTSCRNYDGLKTVVHNDSADGLIDVGTERQLLVDDWPIESWTNVVRFLNAPSQSMPIIEAMGDDDDDARHGCPCSAIPTQSAGVPLQEGGTPDGGPSCYFRSVQPAHMSRGAPEQPLLCLWPSQVCF
jgi:hypothetical protein|eukprot:5334288-Prymnesium_polylepis.1